MTLPELACEMLLYTVMEQRGLSPSLIGQKALFKGKSKRGSLVLPWVEERAASLVDSFLHGGAFSLLEITNPACSEESVTIMADPYIPPPELVVLGGGHISLPLVKIGQILGYRVTVVDDRLDFASAKRFPDADKVICCDFDSLEETVKFGPHTSVVIATRGHMHDYECLRRVLKYPVAYLGMIGSRRKVGLIRSKLLEEGFAKEVINRVHMPVGLDIGGQTPAEIAVSIAAELVLERRRCRREEDARKEESTGKFTSCSELPSAVDREVLQKAVCAALQGEAAALVTIVRTKGSTPRKPGAKMLVFKDGKTYGTVGGGFVESEAQKKAVNVIYEPAPCLYKTVMNASIAAEEGMACGGEMEVFIEPVSSLGSLFAGGD